MSREAPRFGDVFRWKSDSQEVLIMYIAPMAWRDVMATTPAPWDKDWLGVTLDENGIHLAGDVDRRITLAYPGWTEVSDD